MTAGTDTTANTLGWVLWYLATNLDVQNDARQKIFEYISAEGLHEKSEEEVVYIISKFFFFKEMTNLAGLA